jgi:molybdopterin synthase sulfur carrier subunit
MYPTLPSPTHPCEHAQLRRVLTRSAIFEKFFSPEIVYAYSILDEGRGLNDCMASVVVILPSALKAKTGNRTTFQLTGKTVREIIDALEQAAPGLQFSLCTESGELRPYVNIFLGRENIRYLQGLETPTPEGIEIRIFPSVAGG